MKHVVSLIMLVITLVDCEFLYVQPSSCYAITYDEFNSLQPDEQKFMVENSIKFYLEKTTNLSAAYDISWSLCSFDGYQISSKKAPFAKDRYEYRKIGPSFWFHHLWWAAENNKFNKKHTTESYETFNAKDGVLRTFSTASHLAEGEWYAYVMNDHPPACRGAVLPEFFDASCVCNAYTILGHLLQNKGSWKFMDSGQKQWVLIEMNDIVCDAPNDSSGTRKMWLDIEKGFVPVRQQRDLLLVGKKRFDIAEFGDFQQVDNVWIPRKIIAYGSFSSDITKGSGVELFLDTATIGKLKPADLIVDFPRGTKVFDKIRGIEYFEGDILPGDPTTKYYAVRYFLMISGIILIVLAVWRKMVEARQEKGK